MRGDSKSKINLLRLELKIPKKQRIYLKRTKF